jgi:prolyl oligopeptidase
MPLKHAARPAAAVALSVASIVSMVSTSSIVGCAASSGTKPAAPAADAAAPTPANAPNAITMPAPLKLNLRQDNVVDDYHGTKVRDPFRWLEQPDSPDTAAFISATNAHFRGFVDEGPTRDKIKARLMELYNYPRLGAPSVRGKFFVFGTNTGLQNQSIVRVAESVADTTNTDARVLFDPNTLSADGTVALGGTAFTDDGKLVAYELASGGSDETTVHVRDVATGKDLPDTLPLTRQGVTGWLPDNSGFYYNKFPARGTVPPGQEAVNGKLYYHQLGTPTSAD